MLDPSATASRRLDFYPYFLLVGGAPAYDSHWASLEALAAVGFKVNRHRARLRGLDEVLAFRDDCVRRREELPYEIDGVVFKLDSTACWRRVGATSKSPRWAIATKPAAGQAETVVEGIDVQVGRTGAITPRGAAPPRRGARRDGVAGDPPQRGRDRPSGAPDRRSRDRRAQRGRDSEDRARRGGGRGSAAVPDARGLSALRLPRRARGGGGGGALRERQLAPPG